MSALTEISVLSLPFLSRPVISVAAVVLIRLIFVAVLTAIVGDHLERLRQERLRRHGQNSGNWELGFGKNKFQSERCCTFWKLESGSI